MPFKRDAARRVPQTRTCVTNSLGALLRNCRARSLPAQRGEAAIAAAVLNTMVRTAKPVSVRVA